MRFARAAHSASSRIPVASRKSLARGTSTGLPGLPGPSPRTLDAEAAAKARAEAEVMVEQARQALTVVRHHPSLPPRSHAHVRSTPTRGT